MKTILTIGILTIGYFFSGSEIKVENSIELMQKYPLITVTCADGYQSEYYDIGYSEEDIEDIENAICEDHEGFEPPQ
ncbi:MAG: hypothetical protein GYB32_08960 [Algicola sp.]|nr:hypothetical protein [Algicola sp.]